MSGSNEKSYSNWPTWPWEAWASAVQSLNSNFVPHQLQQAINPGWIFAQGVTINSQNSSAPETERAVVAVESYGRQIGRMADLLAVLVTERPADKGERPEIIAFRNMYDKIQRVKTEAARGRVEQLLADIDALRSIPPDDQARLAAGLEKIGFVPKTLQKNEPED